MARYLPIALASLLLATSALPGLAHRGGGRIKPVTPIAQSVTIFTPPADNSTPRRAAGGSSRVKPNRPMVKYPADERTGLPVSTAIASILQAKCRTYIASGGFSQCLYRQHTATDSCSRSLDHPGSNPASQGCLISIVYNASWTYNNGQPADLFFPPFSC